MKSCKVFVITLILIVSVNSFAQGPGDFNCNGFMDVADFVMLLAMRHLDVPPLEDTSGCIWYAGDANYDDLYHTIADWEQLIYMFSGDSLGDNPPQPEELDSLIMADTSGVP